MESENIDNLFGSQQTDRMNEVQTSQDAQRRCTTVFRFPLKDDTSEEKKKRIRPGDESSSGREKKARFASLAKCARELNVVGLYDDVGEGVDGCADLSAAAVKMNESNTMARRTMTY